jgi:dATP pyrophosphohydrolase
VEISVFRFRDVAAEYLLLKRSPDEPLYPNLWQLVSGTMRDGERAVDAALRELKEETGYSAERFWVIPFVGSFYDPQQDVVNLCPMFAAQVNVDTLPVLSPEHVRYEWITYENAIRRLVWPGQRQGLETVHRYLLSGEQAGWLSRLDIGNR